MAISEWAVWRDHLYKDTEKFMTILRPVITGTGAYVPEKIVTNQELSERLGEDISEFVEGNLGIRERHVCAAEESTADLATAAAREALESAGVSPEDVDLIILSTDTPEYISPATSSVVHARLGTRNAANFDLNCACAGFVTALDTGCKFMIADAHYKNILVIGAYAMTKFVDWNDKLTCTIFGDGAGAVLLQAREGGQLGFIGSKLIADGTFYDYMGIYAGGAKMKVTPETCAAGWDKVRFAKRFPPDTNSSRWPRLTREVLREHSLTPDDVSLFLFTQVNESTIREVMVAMDQPYSKTHVVMDKWGYTGSACIPMALHDAVQQGKVHHDDLMVFCASGGGFSMGVVVMRWV